jgi:hypothetical protein
MSNASQHVNVYSQLLQFVDFFKVLQFFDFRTTIRPHKNDNDLLL